jgi:hypothetical protein
MKTYWPVPLPVPGLVVPPVPPVGLPGVPVVPSAVPLGVLGVPLPVVPPVVLGLAGTGAVVGVSGVVDWVDGAVGAD